MVCANAHILVVKFNAILEGNWVRVRGPLYIIFYKQYESTIIYIF